MEQGTKPKDYYTDDKGIVHPIFDVDQIVDNDGDTKIQVEESADEDKIRFDTGGVERMVIDASGVLLGFGDLVSEQNPDPANAIRIKATSSDVDVVLGNVTGYFSVWNAADNNAVFYVDNLGNTDIAGDLTVDTDTLFVDAGNNRVGIGTVSPKNNLQIVDVVQLFQYGSGISGTTNLGRNIYNDGAWKRIIADNEISLFHLAANGDYIFYGNSDANTAADSAITLAELVRIKHATGRVGIGIASPKTLLTVEGTITLKEQAAADGDTAAYGQLWVKTATPNELWFTDDAGTDHQIAYV